MPTNSISVTLELQEEDIAYFRQRLERARTARSPKDEDVIIGGAEKLISKALATNLPTYVQSRIERLRPLIHMLRDTQWRLEGDHRARVLDALAYFVEPDDMIPDSIPGIGYLDDAIMIELVSRELEPEIEAYTDFSAFRKECEDEGEATEGPKVETERASLHRRMRRRARRMRYSGGSGSGRSPLTLF